MAGPTGTGAGRGGSFDLAFSTYFGSSGLDGINAIATDSDGFIYVAGAAGPVDDLPVVDPLQPHIAGSQDAFVAKLSSDGQQVVYCTYLGGRDFDNAFALAVGDSGEMAVVGITASADFPLEAPLQTAHRGGRYDLFVSVLDPTGQSLTFSTLLGGDGDDRPSSIKFASDGSLVIGGSTESSDFPLESALQSSILGDSDCFLTKIAQDGQALLFSSYYGGTSYDACADLDITPSDEIIFCGVTSSADFPMERAMLPALRGDSDGFLAMLSLDGSRVSFSTYFGGSRGETASTVSAGVDGTITIGGSTDSHDFPAVGVGRHKPRGRGDGYVARFSTDGQALIWTARFGGSSGEGAEGIAVDEAGNTWFVGITTSDDFKTSKPLFATFNGRGKRPKFDIIVGRLDPDGRLEFSTYFGGRKRELAFGIALLPGRGAAFAGYTASRNLPTRHALQDSLKEIQGFQADDAFIAAIEESETREQASVVMLTSSYE